MESKKVVKLLRSAIHLLELGHLKEALHILELALALVKKIVKPDQ